MDQEVELKLELDPADAGALGEDSLFKEVEPHSERLVSIYYDTPGGKLRKKGLSLRVRSTPDGFVQTVKSVNPASGLLLRGEWETKVDSLEPHVEQLAHTPAADVGVKRLHPVVCSAVDRTLWKVRDQGSELEVALDNGEVRANGFDEPLCELEIELKQGDPSATFHAARRIAHHVPVRLSVMSKAERGFAIAEGASGKVTKAGPVLVSAEMTVAEGFATIVQSCIRHFRLNEPLVLKQRDADALHQARVAMRRLRSAFSLFRPAISDREFRRLREELRWFTGQLGEARNLDVYLQRDASKHERKLRLEQREEAYDRVVEALNSTRFRLLLIDLMAWVTLGKWRERGKTSRPVAAFAEKRIGRLWLRICGHDDLRVMDDEERHQLRIEVKKLRYALDFVGSLHERVAPRQKRFTKAIGALQEALGRLNDIVNARRLVGSPEVTDDRRLPSEEEVRCLKEAIKYFNRLKLTGPYWSDPRLVALH